MLPGSLFSSSKSAETHCSSLRGYHCCKKVIPVVDSENIACKVYGSDVEHFVVQYRKTRNMAPWQTSQQALKFQEIPKVLITKFLKHVQRDTLYPDVNAESGYYNRQGVIRGFLLCVVRGACTFIVLL